MKIEMPITKRRIQNHFHYAWWMYALLVIIAILGWNLVHTVTRYQSPPHLKVEWFYSGYMTDNGEGADEMLQLAHQEVLADMEEVSFLFLVMDDGYSDMQLTTWSFAGEGDLYTLSREKFSNMANAGAMLNLQPYVDSGVLNLDGVDLTGCYATHPDTGEKWLCGFPMSALPGLTEYNLYWEDHIMSVLINGGNDENTVKLLCWMLEHFGAAAQPAEGLQ